MAGRGSRFTRQGHIVPKPLIEIAGKPFFWWAVQSVARMAPLSEIVFVVLKEHVEHFALDAAIKTHFPKARIVTLKDVTAGAAVTASHGLAALTSDDPVAINDCDHAFAAKDPAALLGALASGTDGALVGFPATSPAYSYVRFAADDPGKVVGTVEKKVVGPYAIAGCYFFGSRDIFARHYAQYLKTCPYDEPFMSGLFNSICAEGGRVMFQALTDHVSFGTPEELDRVESGRLTSLWVGTG